MADERLRQLERRAVDGDVQAASRLLTERARIGALPPNALDLLARLDHPPARVAHPDGPRALPRPSVRLGVIGNATLRHALSDAVTGARSGHRAVLATYCGARTDRRHRVRDLETTGRPACRACRRSRAWLRAELSWLTAWTTNLVLDGPPELALRAGVALLHEAVREWFRRATTLPGREGALTQMMGALGELETLAAYDKLNDGYEGGFPLSPARQRIIRLRGSSPLSGATGRAPAYWLHRLRELTSVAAVQHPSMRAATLNNIVEGSVNCLWRTAYSHASHPRILAEHHGDELERETYACEAIRGELIPWLAGLSDPCRARRNVAPTGITCGRLTRSIQGRGSVCVLLVGHGGPCSNTPEPGRR